MNEPRNRRIECLTPSVIGFDLLPLGASIRAIRKTGSKETGMTIFGKKLSEYASFAKLFLGLIFIVGIARLGLSLAGVGNSTTKWLSISVVTLIALVYYAIRVHTSGFGSYKQLLPIYFLLSLVGEGIVVAGIIIAIATRTDNVFSAPEYSGGGDGKTWLHVLAHGVLGIIIGPLFSWLVGSIIMFITKKVSGERSSGAGARA